MTRGCFTRRRPWPYSSPDSRALIAGGTGRVGRAIAARLERDGLAGRRGRTRRRRPPPPRRRADARGARRGRARRPRPRRPRSRRRLRAEAVEEVTEELWDAALDVTAKGTFFLAQAVAPALRASRGVLVVVEDVAAFRPWTSFAAHSAAKAAQAMLTRVLAGRSRPTSGSAASRPARWRSSRVRRSDGPPRPCSAGSDRPTTWPKPSSIWPGRASSPARRWSSTAGCCSNPARPGFRSTRCDVCDSTPYDAPGDQRRRADPARR